MRLAPVPMYFFQSLDATLYNAVESSRTTHGTQECLDACLYFALVLHRALSGASKEEILAPCEPGLVKSPSIQDIADGNYFSKPREEISGSGYVVQSLEAALWCFHQTDSFREAILLAANLGDDADTTAAICGQVAGAFYGEKGIPKEWLKKLVMAKEIRQMADGLERANQ